MNKIDDSANIICKRKNISVLFDYCLDHKMIFTVEPRTVSNEEFEVELKIESIKQAIAIGMFAKENKYDVVGLGELSRSKNVPAKKAEPKEETEKKAVSPETDDNGATLNFDLNVSNN